MHTRRTTNTRHAPAKNRRRTCRVRSLPCVNSSNATCSSTSWSTNLWCTNQSEIQAHDSLRCDGPYQPGCTCNVNVFSLGLSNATEEQQVYSAIWDITMLQGVCTSTGGRWHVLCSSNLGVTSDTAPANALDLRARIPGNRGATRGQGVRRMGTRARYARGVGVGRE